MQSLIEHYLQLKVSAKEQTQEILIAYLDDLGFESFQQEEEELYAFGKIGSIDKEATEVFLQEFRSNGIQSINRYISWNWENIPPKNWNAEWEENFRDIIIAKRVHVRGTFHQAKDLAYEIVINPKMSFGTGHHSTTALMMEAMLEEDFKNKSVLDMGCGTSILAILAEKLGAKQIVAADNNPVCLENSLENISLNHCVSIEVKEAEVQQLGEEKYDIILANINTNVLLSDLPFLVEKLKTEGVLFISGFLEKDEEKITHASTAIGLNIVTRKTENHWVCLKLQRN